MAIGIEAPAYLVHRNFDQKIADEMRKFNEMVEHGHINLEQAALVRPLMESLRSLVYDALETNPA